MRAVQYTRTLPRKIFNDEEGWPLSVNAVSFSFVVVRVISLISSTATRDSLLITSKMLLCYGICGIL